MNEQVRRLSNVMQMIDTDFLRALSCRYPALTMTELRVCGLICLDLTCREISTVEGTSIRNIENHRYRIRKKIGVKTTDDLKLHILNTHT